MPVHIGDHVLIDSNAVVMAAQIGSFVHIGKNAVIGRRCVLKDCCVVADNAILSPDTVVPPFAVMAGSPAQVVAELPDCTQELMTDVTKSFYQHFVPEK